MFNVKIFKCYDVYVNHKELFNDKIVFIFKETFKENQINIIIKNVKKFMKRQEGCKYNYYSNNNICFIMAIYYICDVKDKNK